MTAFLSNLRLTLSQSSQQRILRVVDVGYAYTLTNTTPATTKDSARVFRAEVDIIGDDVLSDDLLARAVDPHRVQCPPGTSVEISRELTVAQGLLDEDVGDDEIKLIVRVQQDSEQGSNAPQKSSQPPLSPAPLIEATTPIVKGKF